MTTQDKHITTLLNAKCNVVCAADTILKKMNYGEDVGCCINKLTSAIQLINRLDCYCFQDIIVEDEVLAKFTLVVPENNFLDATSVQLISNKGQIGYYLTVGSTYKPTVITSILDSAKITYTTVSGGGNTTFTITQSCDVDSMKTIVTKSKVHTITTLTNTVIGACESNCYNCISDSDLPKMYALLDALLN